MINGEENPSCCCCENKGKYWIASDIVCGVHLAYMVEMHLAMSGEVTVTHLEDCNG